MSVAARMVKPLRGKEYCRQCCVNQEISIENYRNRVHCAPNNNYGRGWLFGGAYRGWFATGWQCSSCNLYYQASDRAICLELHSEPYDGEFRFELCVIS